MVSSCATELNILRKNINIFQSCNCFGHGVVYMQAGLSFVRISSLNKNSFLKADYFFGGEG